MRFLSLALTLFLGVSIIHAQPALDRKQPGKKAALPTPKKPDAAPNLTNPMVRVVLLLDRSESMTRKMKLRGVRQPVTNQDKALASFVFYVRALPANVEVTPLAFAHKTHKLLGGKFTANKQEVLQVVGNIFDKRAPYDTCIWSATAEAINTLATGNAKETSVSRHIIIFSDCVPEKESTAMGTVLENALKQEIRVHVVLYHRNKPKRRISRQDLQNAKSIAAKTGGLYFEVEASASPQLAIQQLLVKIR